MVTSRQRKEEEIKRQRESILSVDGAKRRTRQFERQALRHIYKFLIKRTDNLVLIRREITIWIAGMLVLVAVIFAQSIIYSDQYSVKTGVSGGSLSEGVIGDITDINPLYAKNNNEQSISHILYQGLFSYDSGGYIKPQLVKNYTRSEDGLDYVFTIDNSQVWSDGEPITIDDIIFTFNLISDKEVASTEYETISALRYHKIDENSFSVSLPTSQYNFVQQLTFGILPKHIYEKVAKTDIQEYYINNSPVVSGLYKLESKSSSNEQTIVRLTANDNYHGVKPKIHNIQIQTYKTSEDLRDAVRAGFVNSSSEIIYSDIAKVLENKNLQVSSRKTNNGVFLLFNQMMPTLADNTVREAISSALDTSELRDSLSVNGINQEQVKGFGDKQVFDINAAKAKLDNDGWVVNKSGVRVKGDTALQLNLAVPDGVDYTDIADKISIQMAKIGIAVSVVKIAPESMQSMVISPRSYDLLLYELQLGSKSDQYIYWHSSQASQTGLNLANWKSSIADIAIAGMRTAKSSAEYDTRYEKFLEAFWAETPAVPIYQVSEYLVHDSAMTFGNEIVPNREFNYTGLSNWTTRSGKLQITP